MRKVLSRNSAVNGAGLRVNDVGQGADVIGSSKEELLLLVIQFLTKRSKIKLMRCYVCLLNFTAVFVVFVRDTEMFAFSGTQSCKVACEALQIQSVYCLLAKATNWQLVVGGFQLLVHVIISYANYKELCQSMANRNLYSTFAPEVNQVKVSTNCCPLDVIYHVQKEFPNISEEPSLSIFSLKRQRQQRKFPVICNPVSRMSQL